MSRLLEIESRSGERFEKPFASAWGDWVSVAWGKAAGLVEFSTRHGVIRHRASEEPWFRLTETGLEAARELASAQGCRVRPLGRPRDFSIRASASMKPRAPRRSRKRDEEASRQERWCE